MRTLLLPQRGLYGAGAGGAASGVAYDWQQLTAAFYPASGPTAYWSPSAVPISGGRVLYVACTTGEILGAYAPSVSALVSESFATSGQFVIASGLSYPRATAFGAPDGGLYLALCNLAASGGNMAVQILKGSSDGSAWTGYATVVTGPSSGLSPLGATYLPVGSPLFLPSGRWVLPHPAPYLAVSGDLSATARISTSDDGGQTWTDRFDGFWSGSFGSVFNFLSRTIGQIQGELWWATYDAYGLTATTFYRSSDDGTSWSTAFVVTGVSRAYFQATLVSDAENLYMLGSTPQSGTHLWMASSPPVSASGLLPTSTLIPQGSPLGQDVNLLLAPTSRTEYLIMAGSQQTLSSAYVDGLTVSPTAGPPVPALQGILVSPLPPQSPQPA